jgi:hypothetical protein
MAKVGDSAHTPHGLGTITEVDTVRGRSSFRVAGNGFNVWVDELKLHVATPHYADLSATIDPGWHPVVDRKNVLPYDPTPQYHVDMFRADQNILPGDHEIDADDRLRSSYSQSGDSTSANRPYPGPNPDLFAKSSAYHYAYDPADVDSYGVNLEGQQVAPPATGFPAGGPQDRFQASRHYAEFEDAPEAPDWGDDEWHADLPDGPEDTLREHAAGKHERPGQSYSRPILEGNPGVHRVSDYDKTPDYEEHSDFSFQRPAGLSNRYAWIPEEVDHNDPIVAFRRDPVAFIEAAQFLTAGDYDDDELEARYGSYADLLSADRLMKTAKWTDVRQKAQRLRREGRVHVHDVDFDRIYATVQGDHGTYDCMIKKGSTYGLGGQSISNWHCGCEWGNWAFKRRYSFIGRLCSHGYACYLEMQSRHMKENPAHFAPRKFFHARAGVGEEALLEHAPHLQQLPEELRRHFERNRPYEEEDDSARYSRLAGIVEDYKKWCEDYDYGPEPASVADFLSTAEEDVSDEDAEKLYDYIHEHSEETPEREFDVDYTFDPDKVYKQSDILRTTPGRLQPALHQVPPPADSEMVDVTKDERETTAPDQIVHFSNLQQQIVASLHGAPMQRTADDPHHDWWNPFSWDHREDLPANGADYQIGTHYNKAPDAKTLPQGFYVQVHNPVFGGRNEQSWTVEQAPHQGKIPGTDWEVGQNFAADQADTVNAKLKGTGFYTEAGPGGDLQIRQQPTTSVHQLDPKTGQPVLTSAGQGAPSGGQGAPPGGQGTPPGGQTLPPGVLHGNEPGFNPTEGPLAGYSGLPRSVGQPSKGINPDWAEHPLFNPAQGAPKFDANPNTYAGGAENYNRMIGVTTRPGATGSGATANGGMGSGAGFGGAGHQHDGTWLTSNETTPIDQSHGYSAAGGYQMNGGDTLYNISHRMGLSGNTDSLRVKDSTGNYQQIKDPNSLAVGTQVYSVGADGQPQMKAGTSPSGLKPYDPNAPQTQPGVQGPQQPMVAPDVTKTPPTPAANQPGPIGPSGATPPLSPPSLPAPPVPGKTSRRGRRIYVAADTLDIHSPSPSSGGKSAGPPPDSDDDDTADPKKKKTAPDGGPGANAPVGSPGSTAGPSPSNAPPGMYGPNTMGMGNIGPAGLGMGLPGGGLGLGGGGSMIPNAVGAAEQVAAPIAQSIAPAIGNALSTGLGFLRFLSADDPDNDDDEMRPDTGEAAADLDELRDLCAEPDDEHYQHMDSYNDEIREVMEELHDAGVMASPFVASLHSAAEFFPADAMGNFRGQSTPNWADIPAAGSGPAPKNYISDSESYLDTHERKDMRNLLAEPPDDSPIIKFNDGRSKPPQGPREGRRRQGLAETFGDLGGSIYPNPTLSEGKAGHMTRSAPAGGPGYGYQGGEPLKRSVTTSYHYGDYADEQSGFFNPEGQPTAEDWAGPDEFADQLATSAQQAAGTMPTRGGGGGGGEEAEGGEAAAAAEEIPLVVANRGGFSLEAFDRGEFAPVGWDAGGGAAQYSGELRRAARIGGGPTQAVRIDPGMRRGNNHPSHETYANVMSDSFGNDGDPQLTEYGEPAATPMGSDIVAQFHRSGAAQAIYQQQASSDADYFASSPYVQGMLRTAGRKFTPEEQRELEEEEHHLGARNLPTDADLVGTHYLLGM